MAIQDTSSISSGSSAQAGVMMDVGSDMPAERQFQQGLSQQRLAQIVAPPPTVTTPVAPGPLMPAPVLLNPNAPQNKPPRPGYELTPYTPEPIPAYTPKPANQPGATPGATQGAGNSPVSGTVPHSISGPATAPIPSNISVLNQGLSKISGTLSLELLSPAAQLTINRAADRNMGLNTEYALGLQTAGDGDHLALVGSLQDLIGLLSQAENARFFIPILNADASVTLKGLQQRYTQALNTEADRVALNHTRTQLKRLETANTSGHQSFKQLYPNLSLSTVADRSSPLQNGLVANQKSDAAGKGLNETYVLGYQLPVKLNNNTTVPVPINLVGPLKDLGQFILRGGDSWLQASGLSSNKSTGLTPEGVMQRYGVAKANAGDTFNPDQRSENQTGSTVGQQLKNDVDLSVVTSEESTIPTELPNNTERSPFINVKPSDPDQQNNTGVIGLQPQNTLNPSKPENTERSNTNENGPIRASGADGINDSDDYLKDLEPDELEVEEILGLLQDLDQLTNIEALLALKYMNKTQRQNLVSMVDAEMSRHEAFIRALASGVDGELAEVSAMPNNPNAVYSPAQIRLILAAMAQYQLEANKAIEKETLDRNEYVMIKGYLSYIKGMIKESRLSPKDFEQDDISERPASGMPSANWFSEPIKVALLGLPPALKPVRLRPEAPLVFGAEDMSRLKAALSTYGLQNPGDAEQEFKFWLETEINHFASSENPITFDVLNDHVAELAGDYLGGEIPELILEVIAEPEGLDRKIFVYDRSGEIKVSEAQKELAAFAYSLAAAYRSKQESSSSQVDLVKDSLLQHIRSSDITSDQFANALIAAIEGNHTLADTEAAVKKLQEGSIKLGYDRSSHMLYLFYLGLTYQDEL